MTHSAVRLSIVFILACGASAFPAFALSNHTNGTAASSNVCDLLWYYCPKDPGCTRYQLSAKSVTVYANGYKVVKSEELKAGDHIQLSISGETTFKTVPDDGNYLIYDGAGKNLAAGPLQGAFTVSGSSFELNIEFDLDAASACGAMFEFGVDVFSDKSGGSPEGMCLQIASPERYQEEAQKEGFRLDCTDNGDGSWTPTPSPVVPHPVPAPVCTPTPTPPPPTPGCKLNWFYCPRDPGCVTYKMSVTSVEVDVSGPAIATGVAVHMIVKGKTSVTSVPLSATYKIYDQAGKNMGEGILSDVMSLSGPDFTLKVPTTLDSTVVQGDIIEWGLDIFLGKSGSDEGMCIQFASDAYVAEVQPKASPPFVTYCEDEGNGEFIKKTIPEKVETVQCVLNA